MFFDKHRVKLSYQKCLKKSSNNSPIQCKKLHHIHHHQNHLQHHQIHLVHVQPGARLQCALHSRAFRTLHQVHRVQRRQAGLYKQVNAIMVMVNGNYKKVVSLFSRNMATMMVKILIKT